MAEPALAPNIGPDSAGYCYLRLFKIEQHDQIRARLGPWPALQDVLDQGLATWDDGVWLSLVVSEVDATMVRVHVDNRMERDMRHQFRGWQGKMDLEIFKAWVCSQTSLHIAVGGSQCEREPLAELPNHPQSPPSVGSRCVCGPKGVCHAHSLALTPPARVPYRPLGGVGRCWSLLFEGDDDEEMTIVALRSRLAGRHQILKVKEEFDLRWSFIEIVEGDVWHVGRTWHKPLPGLVHITKAINMITLAIRNGAPRGTLVGLTSILVLGTIGDVQPAVEAASSAFCSAEMGRAMQIKSPVFATDQEMIVLGEDGGVPVESLVEWDSTLAALVRPLFTNPRQLVSVSGSFLSQFRRCPWLVTNTPPTVWVGTPAAPVSAFAPDVQYMLRQGDVEVVPLPRDAVLCTHPEHERLALKKYPGLAFRAVDVPFEDFIKLGQDLMTLKGMMGVGAGLPKLHKWLVSAFNTFASLVQESDLVYCVSGAVVGGILARAYPSRKVFEVCPVPRGPSDICPEFYLSGLIEGFDFGPSWSKNVAKHLDAWLAKSLTKHSGVRVEAGVATRIQAAPGYALDKYDCLGPRVTYKPWAVFNYRSSVIGRLVTCSVCDEMHRPGLSVSPCRRLGGIWGISHCQDEVPVPGMVFLSDLERQFGEHAIMVPRDGLDRSTWNGPLWERVELSPNPRCSCGYTTGNHCLCSLQGLEAPPKFVVYNDGVQMKVPTGGKLKVFFSMGSCQIVNSKTSRWATQLEQCDVEIHCDSRWVNMFSPGRAHAVPYQEHATFLGNYDVVAHHGGAGVTFTCCEVGVWQVVFPQVGDQFEWQRFLKNTGFTLDWSFDELVSLAGTSPGRFLREREVAPPLQSEGTYERLQHWSTVDLPRLAARSAYENAVREAEGKSLSYLWREVWWSATGTTPPHYRPKVGAQAVTQCWNGLLARFGTDEDDVVERLGRAAFAEIGFDGLLSLLKQTPYASLLSLSGTGAVYLKYLWVLRDAMRHYLHFAEAMGMPTGIKVAEPLPNARFTSWVPTRMMIPVWIHTTGDLDAFVTRLPPAQKGESILRIYLRSLKLEGLGRTFGLLHSVIEFKGRWYELSRVRSGRTLVTEWDHPPELLGSPVLKVIDVPVPDKTVIPIRQLKAIIDGNQYRAAGDNCLFFANLLVYIATGGVVPWHHFGLYGCDLPTTLKGIAGSLLEGNFLLGEDDTAMSLRGWSVQQETDFAKVHFNGHLPGWQNRGSTPVPISYGQDAYWVVTDFLKSPEIVANRGRLANTEVKGNLMWIATSKFGMTSGIIHRALEWTKMRNLRFAGDEMDLLVTIGAKLQLSQENALTDAVRGAVTGTRRWWGLRPRVKVVWAPLFSFSTPHHWLYVPEGGVFRTTFRASDRVKLASGYSVQTLDLRAVLENFERVFPEVAFPEIRMERIGPGEWRLDSKHPLRQYTKEMDEDTDRLIQSLLAATDGAIGIYSLRYATADMAEQVTDRYFTGVPTGFLSEEQKDTIANAIVASNPDKYLATKLAAPEDIFKKWHTSYSAGFPYRFNERGNASRADLIAAAGGKKQFLDAVRRYIADPAKYPTVSHAFVKDEVLPSASKEKGKVRTIMAQDVLAYFTQMTVEGDLNKRMDPDSFSAVGVAPQHGGLAEVAAKHKKFSNHYASDITALDSRLAKDYLDVCTRVRKKGFENHPQRAAAEELLDVCAENLYTSWVIDIHSGRARLKRQGASTGHASTTGTNSLYVEVMFLDAWIQTTGRTCEEFYEQVKVSTYSDDNMWSTDLPREVFGPEVLQDYLARRGVHLKAEAEGKSIDDIPFLAKWFSTKEADIEHVHSALGFKPQVCVLHDRSRLVMKFSDIKGKATLLHRWDRAASFLENCAHHPDLHAMVWDYLHQDLAPRMARRNDTRKWMQKRKPRTYQEVLELMYLTKEGSPVLPESDYPAWDSFVAALEKTRTEILAWDGTLNSTSRLIERWAGFLHIFGVEGERTGADVSDYAKSHLDTEFILERHLYMHAGCPPDLQSLAVLRTQSPFSAFMRLEEFFRRRHNWTYSEQDKSMLNAGVAALQVTYCMVAALEQVVRKAPVIGPMYRLFTSVKGLSAEMYANMNAVFYTMFGSSSAVLSALIPRDSHEHLKFLAVRLWGQWTHCLPDLPEADWAALKELTESWLGVVGMVHSLTLEGQTWILAPTRNNPSAPTPTPNGALLHEDAVRTTINLLGSGDVPMITAPTGAGKSTDFVVAISKHFESVYLSLPRRILVQTNPVVQTRCYAGSEDKLGHGVINGATHGYLRQALPALGPRDLLLLDEFHELDEDALVLLRKYRGQVLVITATPDKLKGFAEVRLSESRVGAYTVTKEVRKMPGRLEDKIVELIRGEFQGHKAMVIIPSVRKCSVVAKALGRQAPGLRVKLVSKSDPTTPEADVYVCTSVVDAGITIPGVELVIDSGKAVGYKGGTFVTCDTSRAVAEQRAGRTGRTCSGTYVRLNQAFDDDKFDFSTTFASNYRDLAQHYGERRRFEPTEEVVPWLPGIYNEWVYRQDFSACVFWWLLTESKNDIGKAQTEYGSMMSHPNDARWHFIYELYGKPLLQPWDHVLARVCEWTFDGVHNALSPQTGEKVALKLEHPNAHPIPFQKHRRACADEAERHGFGINAPALAGVF